MRRLAVRSQFARRGRRTAGQARSGALSARGMREVLAGREPAGAGHLPRAGVQAVPVSPGDGRPDPRGVSLTGRAGCAGCLVAARPHAVGCDLELAEPRSEAFVRDCLGVPCRRMPGASLMIPLRRPGGREGR